jgi:hypothetical protein
MWAGSAVVLAISQSSTADRSATSFGPATSIRPPESHQPRGVYDSTVYPRPASVFASIRYSSSLSPQLLMNTTAGCRPAVVGSTTFAFRTTPSAPGMSTNRSPVVVAEAGPAVATAVMATVQIATRPSSPARRPGRGSAMRTSQETRRLPAGNQSYRRVTYP